MVDSLNAEDREKKAKSLFNKREKSIRKEETYIFTAAFD